MTLNPLQSGIRDNHRRGAVGDFKSILSAFGNGFLLQAVGQFDPIHFDFENLFINNIDAQLLLALGDPKRLRPWILASAISIFGAGSNSIYTLARKMTEPN